MLSDAKIDEIRNLLTQGGRSHRAIARLAGVSRGTVGAVAAGRRADRKNAPVDPDDLPPGPVIRCPECGGKVYSPCRLCRVRALKSAERADRRRTAGRPDAATPESLRRRCDPTFDRDGR